MHTYLYQFILGLFMALIVPVVGFAQEPVSGIPTDAPVESDEPLLIANVNFTGVSTSTEGTTAVAVFRLKNSFGRQDGITYGVIFRSVKTGELLASFSAKNTISLKEGESKELDFVYTVPDYLAEAASVQLAAYNQAGLPLAFYNIDTVAKGSKAVTCQIASDVVNCDVSSPVNAEVVVREGSPQGAVVLNQQMKVDNDSPIELAAVTAALQPGRYVASIILSDRVSGYTVGSYATDFTKVGDFGKLMSVSPRQVDGGVDVTIYAEVGYTTNDAPLGLTVDLGTCAPAQSVTFDTSVKRLHFDTSCSGGCRNCQAYGRGYNT